MEAVRRARGFFSALRRLSRQEGKTGKSALPSAVSPPPKIGLALGGGFARGIAHTGVLNVLQRRGVPIHCIAGVSAGSIVAAAFASGTAPDEIARAGCAMRFGDVARWSLCRMGLVASTRMENFLERLLKRYRFEEMQTPLGVIATDLISGEPVAFRGSGDTFLPIRASCSYPGLFQPVRWEDRVLVDGAMSMEIPALLARQLGATHVISVHLPASPDGPLPKNVFQVVNRCFQILQTGMEESWRRNSDVVIQPDVCGVEWDGFSCGPALIKAGEAAAEAALPLIEKLFPELEPPVLELSPFTAPGSITA
jgi:NTE family protein